MLNPLHSDFIQVLESLRASETFDKVVGAYACEIELLTPIVDLIALIKNEELNLELTASLSNGVSAISNLRMVPAINVSPQLISIEQLDQQIITVTGLDKVLQKIEVNF